MNLFRNGDKPKWQFIKNGNGDMNSIESTDTESFQRVPIDSLARELTQNSLDARVGEHAAKIEFRTFKMKVKDIPGIDDLKKEIQSCIDFYPSNSLYQRLFVNMFQELDKDDIQCLRISDYYTTGLEGVASGKNMTPFNYLVKGNGFTSKKGKNSGGSKGMGKFSTFLSSSIHTVFYSTLNMNNERGYMGVVKLGSRELDDSSQMTTGKGYYSVGEKVLPILKNFSLDKDFVRNDGIYGTDVYIIGFKMPSNWKKQIISKVLDSFMVAVHNGDLEIQIEDLLINQSTLQSIIFNTNFSKIDKRNIESQYELLNEKIVYHKSVNIMNKGNIDFYLKDYNRNEKDKATNKCIMIRHPFMKIREYKIPFPVSASAMCIIGENELNNQLKEIENAEHTDWEPNRIENSTGDPLMVKEMKEVIKTIQEEMKKFIIETLLSGKTDEIDLEFAGDYLPDLGIGDNESSIQQDVIPEKPTVGEDKRIPFTSKFGTNEDDDSNSLMPDIGEHIEGNESKTPTGQNIGGSGDIHGGNLDSGIDENGNDVIMRKVHLTGIKPKVIILDKSIGKYLITYKGSKNASNCELEFFYLDDNNTKYIPIIKSAIIDNCQLKVDKNKIVGFEMLKDKIYRIELLTTLNDVYASEVSLYENVSE